MKLRHAMIFSRTLTPLKLVNAARLLVSYLVSRTTGRSWHNGLPMSLAVEPTTACNLGCPQCPSGLKQFTRPTGNLREKNFMEIIDQVGRYICNLTFYFQGEPFINPAFLNMVKYAAERNIYTSTSTNGHFLDVETAERTVASGLHRLIISLDGTTQEVYSKYRVNGELSKVLQGIRNLTEAKKKKGSATPFIVLQFIVMKSNEHQIPQVQRLAREYGVDDLQLKTAQIYDFEGGSNMIPSDDRYSRYAAGPQGYVLKNTLENHCWRMWNSTVITWDGSVVPCCFDKDARHSMGKLQGQNFRQIWKGQQYNHFRKQVLDSRKNIDICSNCSEGTRIWA